MVPHLFISAGVATSRGFIFYGSGWLWNVLVHGLENNHQHFIYGFGNFNCAVFVSKPTAALILRFLYFILYSPVHNDMMY